MSVFCFQFLLIFLVAYIIKIISADDDNIILSGDTTIIVSDTDRFNNTAFNASLQDFLYDFYNVFGLVPLKFDPSKYSIPCSLGNNTISVLYIGLFSSNPYPISLLPHTNIKECYNGKESHCVRVLYDNKFNIYSMIAMSDDTLGAIYALFTISQHIFGIQPLYRFSGMNGFDYTDSGYLTIKNGKHLSYIYNSPLFEYRGLFPNDEDLLGGFGADPYGESVFSGYIFSWLFESILRMKGNMMQIGTVTYPDEISIKLAYKRGLYINAASHFNLFNSNTKQFPSQLTNEWQWNIYPMTPTFVWISSMNALLKDIPNQHIIWSVGYRGLWDTSAPCTNCTEEEKGLMITQVIGNMSNNWLPSNSKKITFMWSEGINQLSKGYLIIPNDVSIILTDNGNGYINDLNSFGNRSEGIYIHTAMESGWANQLTELTNPERFRQQITKFTNTSKKNKYAIINTSDLKPVLLSTNAVFCYLWNPNDCGKNGNDYILNWCLRHYLLKEQNVFDDDINYFVAKQVTDLYERYYNISYVFKGISDENISLSIQNTAQYVMNDILNNKGIINNSTLTKISWLLRSNQTIQYINSLWNDSIALYNDVILSVLSEESIHLFESHVLLQQSFHYFGNLALYDIYYSALNYFDGNMDESMEYIQSSLNDIQQIFKFCRKSEQYNNWKGLYYNSLLSDWQRMRSIIKRLKGLIQNGYNSCLLPVRPYSYYSWTWYQIPQSDNYPLFHYNASYHINTYIRIHCINTGNQVNNNNITNCCVNNENGGTFITQNGCNAMIELNVLRWDICKYIKYTMNGLIPNESSYAITRNNNIMNITKSTNIQARCQYFDGLLDPQITSAYFDKM